WAGASCLQRCFHPLLHSSIDNPRPKRQLAPVGGIGDQFTHTRNARFVDEINDELQFVKACEVGKFRRIAGANECIETGANERACSSQRTACSPKRSVSVSSQKVVSITPACV